MTRIPRGYYVDHQNASECIVSCPDCEAREQTSYPPSSAKRHCRDCDRLKGVTPISRGCKPRADGGRVMTDGGRDTASLSDVVNGMTGLFARHVGGTRYRVLSARNDAATAYKVDVGDLSCTCPDFRYNQDDPAVCDHLAVALHGAPKRITVEDNLVSDLSHLVREMGEAADKATDAATEIDTALVGQRAVEADKAATDESEASQDTSEPDRPSVTDTTPMVDPPEAAEKLQEAFDNVVDGMEVELQNDKVWVKTGYDTPDEMPFPGKPDTWETLIKNPEHVKYDPDASSPGEYWKNYVEPDAVDDYISEVLE